MMVLDGYWQQLYGTVRCYTAGGRTIISSASSLQTHAERNLSRVNDILYDACARLWAEGARCSECMRSHRVSHVPNPFGDRPSSLRTLLPAPWQPASSSRRPLHIETRMHARSHYI